MHIIELRTVCNSPAPAAARYAASLIRAGLADRHLILRRALAPICTPASVSTSHDMVRQ
jgi:hypothetical protein